MTLVIVNERMTVSGLKSNQDSVMSFLSLQCSCQLRHFIFNCGDICFKYKV